MNLVLTDRNNAPADRFHGRLVALRPIGRASVPGHIGWRDPWQRRSLLTMFTQQCRQAAGLPRDDQHRNDRHRQQLSELFPVRIPDDRPLGMLEWTGLQERS